MGRRYWDDRFMDFEFLLIGRHGRLSDLGTVYEVAQGLAKTLCEPKKSDWPMAITAVVFADTPDSRATAEIWDSSSFGGESGVGRPLVLT
jgi:hypothetical protein